MATSKNHKFSLPPGVRGTPRGNLKVEVYDAAGPVYMLWWGETKEMRIMPKNLCTIFDTYKLDVPIHTSDEKFFSYLRDDSIIDVCHFKILVSLHLALTFCSNHCCL